MKNLFHILLVFLLVLAGLETVFGDSLPATTLPVRSVFAPPSSPGEGRDPFFPESARPFESLRKTNSIVEVISLKLSGISVVNGISMAIINNHTFAAGDEGQVLSNGKPVHIRCLEIRNDMASVLVNGKKQDIRFGAK